MRALQRWPLVGAVGALLVGSMLLDNVPDAEAPSLVEINTPLVRSALTVPAPLTSSWYCAIGSSNPGGYADHVVHVTNASPEDATGTISVVTEDGAGPSLRFDLGPYGTETIDLSSVTSAENTAAVVEVVGGQGLVGHDVTTRFGSSSGPCATTVADSWYFASGSTRRDSDQYIALMNPFGEDVVLDVTFRTGTRDRRPEDLTSFPVQGRTVKVINVADYVSIEAVVATTITAVQGRVVAEQLQVANGDLGPAGAALALGVTSPASEWTIPAGRVAENGDHQLVIFNPGIEQAQIELFFDLSTTEQRSAYGLGTPIELTVQPGRFESLDVADLLAALQVPFPIEFGMRVVSDNGVPVVVSRTQRYPAVDSSLVGAEDSGATVEVAGAEVDAGDGVLGDGTGDSGDSALSEDGTESLTQGADPVVVTVDPSTVERRDPLGGSLLRQDDDGQVDNEHGDVPLSSIGPSVALSILDDSAQPAATSGLSSQPGYSALTRDWVVPYTRFLPDGGTVLVISASEDSLVTIRGLVDGRLLNPERVSIAGQTRRVVPIFLPVPRSALMISGTAPIAVEVQTVDAEGRLTTASAVPVLAR